MNKIKQLAQSYKRHIEVPWRSDAAPPQRVIFCIYHETEELRLRTKIDDFEQITRQSDHDWVLFDITDTFAEWLSIHRYAKSYFKKPHLLPTLMPNYLAFLKQKFENFITEQNIDNNTVVAIMGVGSLFGLLKVKEVVEKFAPLVPGRLLVFFPGSYEDKNYRLLDGYDGWNYHAVPITADKEC